MVMPLVHESRPKCYMCHESFETIEALREHKKMAHGKEPSNEPRTASLGDVNVF